MAYKVLISSAFKDQDLARDLAQRLKAPEVKSHFHFDTQIPGKSVEKSVISDVSDADEVIVILTENSVDSPWLMFQMGAASSLKKRVTPIIVGIEDSKLPSLVRHMYYIKYADLSKYISTLEKRAKEAA